MPELVLQNIEVWLAQFLLPLFRISAFFMAVPIIGTRMVPPRIRMLMALAVTVVVAPLVQISAPAIGFNIVTITAVMQEVVTGIVFGFFLQIFFHLFIISGQMIAMQMGLGFASMVDPSNGISVAVVSQLFVILTTLLFLAMNGHLVMIEIVVESFTVIPPMTGVDWSNAFWTIAGYGSWMFSKALLLALPAVSALLIVNLAFGVMARSAPQLNIFSLGFPSAIVLGGVFIWLALAGFLPGYLLLQEEAFAGMQQLMVPLTP